MYDTMMEDWSWRRLDGILYMKRAKWNIYTTLRGNTNKKLEVERVRLAGCMQSDDWLFLYPDVITITLYMKSSPGHFGRVDLISITLWYETEL